MSRADSTIRVLILGDAKGLQGELRSADKGVKGFGASWKGLAAGLATGVVTSELLDFAQTALGEADRLGDATQRLELQLGDLSGPLVKNADQFAKLGASAQDILELEAAFADTGTALGLADPLIASFADDAAATAAAMALMSDTDAATIVDQIGKAAGGSEKALKALGINLSDAEIATRALRDTGKTIPAQLTDSEKAAAAYELVLEKLAPRLDAVAAGQGDLEQSQAELQARWETLTGRIGQGLEGPLNDLLGWILSGIDGWEMMAGKVGELQSALESLSGPLGDAIDLLSSFVGLAGDALRMDFGSIGRRAGLTAPAPAPSGFRGDPGRAPRVTVNVNGGDPAEVERSVKRAIRGYTGRSGPLISD